MGRVARERILADDNVDRTAELKTTGKKLVVVAYLLQAMPKPSTTSRRNLCHEAQVLIEQAAVQQAESRARQPQQMARRNPRCTTALEGPP